MSSRLLTTMLLFAGSALANLGTPVPLTITDRSGYARTNEGVTTGVPLPQSANITDVRTLMLTTSNAGDCSGGTTVDSMLHVVERWQGTPTDITRPIRWVWVEAAVPSLPANGSIVYCLKDRVGSDPGTSALTVSQSGGFITVNTGAMTFKVSTAAFNFLDTVTVGGTAVVNSSASNTWKVTAGGVEYNTSNTGGAYSAIVEYPGVTGDANSAGENIRAQIKLSGKFTSAAGAQKFSYQMRLIAYAGGTTITVRPVLTFSEDMFAAANKPTGITLSLPLAMGNSLSYTFGTDTGASSGAYSPADDLYQLQYDHGHGTPTGRAGNAIVKNGAMLGGEGHQAPGWLDLNDGSVGATVWVRDFWQRYPMELEAQGKTLNVHLWPVHVNTGVAGIGDGTGPNDQIFAAKRDAALSATTNLLAYGGIWPYAGGAAMELTPIVPNLQRTIYTVAQGSTTTLTSNLNVSVPLYCTNQPGPSCHYWPSGTSQRVSLNGFTGCWSVMNGFHNATFNGAYSISGFPLITIDADTSACGSAVTPALNQGTSVDPTISNIDTLTDMQAQGTAQEWEIQYQFHAGSIPPAPATVAALKDRLMLTNPAWLASSQAFGRIKEVDTAEFPAAEANVVTAWTAFTDAVDALNLYGSANYGDYIYDPSSSPAGYGSRWWAFSRKNWQAAPWMMYARTGDPQYLNRAISVTLHGVNVDVSHQTVGPYVDSNGNTIQKMAGSGPCTHGGSHWYPVFEGYAVPPAYSCTEGQEPTLDYVSDAAEAMFLLTAHDRSKEVVANEIYPFMTYLATASDSIMSTISGRSLGGCWQLTTSMNRMTGTGLDYAEKCFQGAVQHSDGTASLGNPVGYVQGDKYGNSVWWSYFADSWVQQSFAEYAEQDPNYCALDAQGVSHCVRDELNRFAKAFTGMGLTSNTTGVYYYSLQGKSPSYAYKYTGNTEYLKILKRIHDQFLQPLNFIVGNRNATGGTGYIDVHYWGNYLNEMPYLIAGLSGKTVPPPDNPAYPVTIPADGRTVTWLVNKTADQNWTATFLIDTNNDEGGDFPALSGTVTIDIQNPSGVIVSHQVRSACTYNGPVPCIPNSWYPVESNTTTPGHGMSITYGGVDNRLWTVTVPADGLTGEYKIQISVVNGTGGTCNMDGNDRYTCYTTEHFAWPFGTSLGNMTMVTPSVLDLDCSRNPYQTPHVGRGLYYFNVPASTPQIQASMSRTNSFLLSPSGIKYGFNTTSTVPPEPGMWALATDSQLDDGWGTGYCISLKGVKSLLAASPQNYYDSPYQPVSNTIMDYGGKVTVNFSGKILSVSPAALNFRCASSGVAPPAQSLAISLIGGTLDNWSAKATQGWLTLSPQTGSAAGSSQAAVACAGLLPGTYYDTVTVSSTTLNVGANPLNVPVTLTVSASPVITKLSLKPGSPGQLYADTLTATGGQPPYTWDVFSGQLCDGLLLSAAGAISGLPLKPQACAFTVRVTDTFGATAVQPLSISIQGLTMWPTLGAATVSGVTVR